MTKSIGTAIPARVGRRFDGRITKSRIGTVITLLTAGGDASPSIALLSVGEVLIINATTVRIALWPGSTSTANLEQARRGTLALIDANGAFYVRLDAERGIDLSIEGRARAFFECRVVDVRTDTVPYARITHGITFDLVDPAPVLRQWKATIEAMRAVT